MYIKSQFVWGRIVSENYVCAAKPIHCERERVSEWMNVLHFINPELFDPIHTWY